MLRGMPEGLKDWALVCAEKGPSLVERLSAFPCVKKGGLALLSGGTEPADPIMVVEDVTEVGDRVLCFVSVGDAYMVVPDRALRSAYEAGSSPCRWGT